MAEYGWEGGSRAGDAGVDDFPSAEEMVAGEVGESGVDFLFCASLSQVEEPNTDSVAKATLLKAELEDCRRTFRSKACDGVKAVCVLSMAAAARTRKPLDRLDLLLFEAGPFGLSGVGVGGTVCCPWHEKGGSWFESETDRPGLRVCRAPPS